MTTRWIRNSGFVIDSSLELRHSSLFSMDNLTNPKTLLVEPDKPPIIEPGHTFGSVSDKIGSFVLTHRTPKGWWVGFGIGFIGVMLLGQTLANLLLRGTGIWGVTNPVGWGFDIINFVWWIGIGHAGTLISAILFCCGRNGERRSTGLLKR